MKINVLYKLRAHKIQVKIFAENCSCSSESANIYPVDPCHPVLSFEGDVSVTTKVILKQKSFGTRPNFS